MSDQVVQNPSFQVVPIQVVSSVPQPMMEPAVVIPPVNATEVNDEESIPLGLIQVFRMINKFKKTCKIYIILLVLSIIGIPLIFPFIIGLFFANDLDICYLHFFYGSFMISFYVGTISSFGSIVYYLYAAFRTTATQVYLVLALTTFLLYIPFWLYNYIPYRQSETLKQSLQYYSYIPYTQIRSWYYQEFWGSNTSRKRIREAIAAEEAEE